MGTPYPTVGDTTRFVGDEQSRLRLHVGRGVGFAMQEEELETRFEELAIVVTSRDVEESIDIWGRRSVSKTGPEKMLVNLTVQLTQMETM